MLKEKAEQLRSKVSEAQKKPMILQAAAVSALVGDAVELICEQAAVIDEQQKQIKYLSGVR